MNESKHLSSKNFYSDLNAFEEFSQVAELDQYVPLPDDWVILTSDVVGSTLAIEAGNYKQVNMAGAASIMCILNACDNIEVPFSFGGDGGLVVVPARVAKQASIELQKLQSACEGIFGLSLRAAAIPVGDLRAKNGDILVRKFALNDDNHLAMFAGNGTSMADDWLKSDDSVHEKFRLRSTDKTPPDLDGLSCRWEPLASMNGVMLTIIIKPADDKNLDIASQVSKVLNNSLAGFTPVHTQSLKFRFPPRGLRIEVAAARQYASWLGAYRRALFTSLMQWICEKFQVKIGEYDGSSYKDELISSTDFRKYDGALRMVLDLSKSQADKLENWLEEEFQQRNLVYGTWRSSSALMTCMLFDLAQSRHLHLVDGADGGYAMAAKEYKRRMAGS